MDFTSLYPSRTILFKNENQCFGQLHFDNFMKLKKTLLFTPSHYFFCSCTKETESIQYDYPTNFQVFRGNFHFDPCTMVINHEYSDRCLQYFEAILMDLSLNLPRIHEVLLSYKTGLPFELSLLNTR